MPISLEKPVGDEEECELGQLIADEQAESAYERATEILTNEALRDALKILSCRERRVIELRDGPGEERARQELLATGARPRRQILRGRDALTPTEARVADMAAQGLSTPEIAQALFVTPRQ